MASFPLPYPELVFPPWSRNPSGGILHCDAWIRRGRNPPGRRAAFSYAARAKLSSAPIGVCRLFNEDSGDLGSLPAPQHSTSKPFHPQIGNSTTYNVTGSEVFRTRRGDWRLAPSVTASQLETVRLPLATGSERGVESKGRWAQAAA